MSSSQEWVFASGTPTRVVQHPYKSPKKKKKMKSELTNRDINPLYVKNLIPHFLGLQKAC